MDGKRYYMERNTEDELEELVLNGRECQLWDIRVEYQSKSLGLSSNSIILDRVEFINDDDGALIASRLGSWEYLYKAAKRIYDHLNARIEQAVESGYDIPVFDGIAELHDVLTRARMEAVR